MKYKDWLAIWLQNNVKPTTKERTYIRYNELINGHIIPKLGEYELNEITALSLQIFITELLQDGNKINGKGLSVNTVNTIITVIQGSLKSATIYGELKEYIADRIKRPKGNEAKVSCFSPIEQKKIEDAILNNKKDKLFGIVLCLYTGLRIGELLALTWDDIDFYSGFLSVSKSCYYAVSKNGDYRRCIDTPKTVSSCRTIPLPKQVIVRLKEIKKRSKSEFLISNGVNPVSIRSYQRTFALLLRKLKIEHKGFHALRHTFATRALECGMDVKTLSEILGHKNANITLDRYVHSLMKHKQEMMNILGKLLK